MLELETFRVSTLETPQRLGPLTRERLSASRTHRDVTRADVTRICGSAAAANQFIDTMTKGGFLVPTGWGTYRAVSPDTEELLLRVAHPIYRRFVGWTHVLHHVAQRQVTYLAPWVWQFTDLNVQDPMVALALAWDDVVVRGAPPQWDAFFADIHQHAACRLFVGEDEAGRFLVPSLEDVIFVMWHGLGRWDPRWEEAAHQLADTTGSRDRLANVRQRAAEVRMGEAPRGRASVRVGLGGPHRRRVLLPRWAWELHVQGLHVSADPQGGGE